MLKVVGSVPTANCQTTIDDYIPVSFRCLSTGAPLLHWRTGNLDTSLLDIGIDPNDGAICAATVTLIDPSTISTDGGHVKAGQKIQGAPVCDINDWPDSRYRDESFPFTVAIGSESVQFWLSHEMPVQMMYEVGHMRFGIGTEGALCLLEVVNLTRRDLDRIIGVSDD